MFYIYKLSFEDYFYYGFTNNPNRRLTQHLNNARNLTKSYKLYNYLKNNLESYNFEIIENLDNKENAIKKENDLIRNNLNNEKCLNERLSFRTIQDKKNQWIKDSKKYRDNLSNEKKQINKEKKKLYMRKKRFREKRINKYQNYINEYNSYKVLKKSNPLI